MLDLLRQFEAARMPEDIFGNVKSINELNKRYRQLARLVHPDYNPRQKVEAERAFSLLQKFKSEAVKNMSEPVEVMETKPVKSDYFDEILTDLFNQFDKMQSK